MQLKIVVWTVFCTVHTRTKNHPLNDLKFFVVLLSLVYSTTLRGQCENYEHQDIFEQSWLSCTALYHPVLGETLHWVEYDLTYPRRLGSTHFWNFNKATEITQGVKDFRIYTSLDRIAWTLRATDVLEIASGQQDYAGSIGPDLSGIATRYILLAFDSNFGGTCTGLSEVKFEIEESSCTDINVQLTLTKNVCADIITTDAILNVTGGQGPYSYHWSNGARSAEIDDIDPGFYEVLVVDQLGCVQAFNLVVEDILEDQSLIDEDTIVSNTYYGDSISSSGKICAFSDVHFLHNSSTTLLSDFTVEKEGGFEISFINCLVDSLSQFSNKSDLENDIPSDIHRTFIGLGNDQYVTVSSSDENASQKDEFTLSGRGLLDGEAAGRFLSQATLGYNSEMIARVREMGINEWLNWQTSIGFDSYFNHFIHNTRFGQPRIDYWLDFHRTWWHNTLTGDEFLRERMAFALSQIFVISSKSFLLNYGDGMTAYHDMLMEHSFGSYRDLLYDVTMSPMMGFYLSHLNNPKADPSINQFPDENYAREILQLFSIGLYELNIDGTRKKDAHGNDIPTYTNEDIVEFAKVFTGLSFATKPFGTPGNVAAAEKLPYTVPMKMNEEYHEQGEKRLLNGSVLPEGMTGIEDINFALDNIFNHANVGPFIATRLIQRLVKSEPSPQYVQRVAEAFNDNSNGERGDLKAVVLAILIDPEARDCEMMEDPSHGMLREPIVRLIHLFKAFGISSTDGTFYALGETIERLTQQVPLGAPSVFNFFQSDYTAPGPLSDQNIRSPEFGILNSYTSIGYTNLIDSISSNLRVLDLEEGEAFLVFEDEILAASNINLLINMLDIKLTYGHLSDRTRGILEEALNLIGPIPEDRVKMALYIIANSPEFSILK